MRPPYHLIRKAWRGKVSCEGKRGGQNVANSLLRDLWMSPQMGFFTGKSSFRPRERRERGAREARKRAGRGGATIWAVTYG